MGLVYIMVGAMIGWIIGMNVIAPLLGVYGTLYAWPVASTSAIVGFVLWGVSPLPNVTHMMRPAQAEGDEVSDV